MLTVRVIKANNKNKQIKKNRGGKRKLKTPRVIKCGAKTEIYSVQIPR